ncbi:MAG: hypothetical protein K6T34_10640 [Thermoflavifilum sp.]|nr:hypothetical protein [Thermoflavifilum sp.]
MKQQIELSVLDRLMLPLFLPNKANIVDGQLIRDIRSQVAFSAEEIEDFNIIQHPDGRISWDSKKEKFKTISLTPRQLAILKAGIEEADKNASIPIDAIQLVDKILKF